MKLINKINIGTFVSLFHPAHPSEQVLAKALERQNIDPAFAKPCSPYP